MKLSVDGRYRLAAKLAFVAGLGVVSGVSYAQDTTTSDDSSSDDAQLQTVVVTGSRIKQTQFSATSPITAVTAEDIQYQGVTRVEDMLNSMPQVFAAQGANISNGATGTATVDLRNLGSSRTLVLIDGKRLPPGDPTSPAADLNFIPSALVDRIDIATGGASAVYGSDAIAGVVNFIMKRDFQGFELDVQRSGYYHDNDNKYAQDLNAASGFDSPSGTSFDGKGWDLSAVMGFNTSDGKGNATAYMTYRQIDAVNEAQRDYSACTFGSTDDGYACSGSSTSATGRFYDGTFSGSSTTTVDVDADGNPILRAWDSSTDLFNYAPYNYYQRNDERYTLGAFAHYEFNEHLDIYTDLMFMSDQTNAVIAPSGAFGVEYTAPCDGSNPLISAEQLAVLCSSSNPDPGYAYILRRNVEGGGRDDDLQHQSYRMMLGAKGAIDDVWSYDIYGQYSQSTLQEIYYNDFSVTRIQRALDVVSDSDGNPVCASVLDGSDPDCVPWNIWTPGGVTQEALEYLQTPGLLNGHTEQQIASASVSANLGAYGIQSPFSAEGVGFALGGEYRREATVYTTDLEFSTGDLAGQGGATIGNSGAFHVNEIFTELRLPLVSDAPLAYDLGLELGYRYTDHSAVGGIDTYKTSAYYSPVRSLTFRGGYNRATRAPSILEVAQPTQVALDGSTDPCAGSDPSASLEECLNDPVIAANPSLYGNISENSAGQYNGQLGVDPNLKPETADTYTAGIVWSPDFVRGLNVTVDFFDIKVKGLISGYGADTILDTCYTEGLLCDLIHRDSASGSLWLNDNGYVVDTTQNAGSLTTRGVDFTVDYRTTFVDLGLPDYGTLGFNYSATYQDRYSVVPIPGGSNYECSGDYGSQCGTPSPQYRHKMRVTWGTPWAGVRTSLQWRFFGHVDADALTDANTMDKRFGSQSYIDLYGSVPVGPAVLEAGINNLFDREPPLNGLSLGNGNTYSQVYDVLGTYAFAGMRLNF